MSQSRTANFIAQAEADVHSPVLLVRLIMSDLTKYLTSRQGTYDGQVYEELMSEGLTLNMSLDRFGRVAQSVGDLVLANGAIRGKNRFSDLLGTHTLDNAEVQADVAFYGQADEDWLRTFKGCAVIPESDAFDDKQFRLQLLDEGQPAQPELIALRANRIHKILGKRITTTTWPKADPDVLGAIEPELFGLVQGTHALAVDAGVVDALAADVTDVQTTLPLSDAARFALLPVAGTVQIEEEEITYTGKTPATLTLTGCARGVGSTDPAAHTQGTPVLQLQATYRYLVARHACKSVAAVKADGVLQTTGYSVDLSGPTVITFTSKPRRDALVRVTQQPVVTAAITAEQSPGAIGTTAEQAPGAIGTTAEHTNTISSEGSHDHAVTVSAHEYPTTPSLPVSSSGTINVDYAATPAGGTYAYWHIYVNVISGNWHLGDYYGADYGALSAADNYITDTSPRQTGYRIWLATGTGNIDIYMIERDIQVASGTAAHAASGIGAGRSGSTATSMAALAGATATTMATLAGSTAVSASRTQDVVVTGGDLEVGQVITCDVEGITDTAGGTYTGTPNALITNPSDQLRYLIGSSLSLSLSDYVDSPSFNAARAAFSAAGIRADWGLYEQMDSAELMERLRWSTASRLFLNQEGRFKLYVLPVTQSPLDSVSERAQGLDEESGGGAWRVGRGRLTDMINHVWLGYAKEITTGAYRGVVETQDATSQTKYRTDNGLIVENDFVRDATAAAAIAAKYLAWHKDVPWRVQATFHGIPTLHYELMDELLLTSQRMPGGWSGQPYRIEGIRRTLLPAGGDPPPPSRCELTLVQVTA